MPPECDEPASNWGGGGGDRKKALTASTDRWSGRSDRDWHFDVTPSPALALTAPHAAPFYRPLTQVVGVCGEKTRRHRQELCALLTHSCLAPSAHVDLKTRNVRRSR